MILVMLALGGPATVAVVRTAGPEYESPHSSMYSGTNDRGSVPVGRGQSPPDSTAKVTLVLAPFVTRPTWIKPLASTGVPLTSQPAGRAGVNARSEASPILVPAALVMNKVMEWVMEPIAQYSTNRGFGSSESPKDKSG